MDLKEHSSSFKKCWYFILQVVFVQPHQMVSTWCPQCVYQPGIWGQSWSQILRRQSALMFPKRQRITENRGNHSFFRTHPESVWYRLPLLADYTQFKWPGFAANTPSHQKRLAKFYTLIFKNKSKRKFMCYYTNKIHFRLRTLTSYWEDSSSGRPAHNTIPRILFLPHVYQCAVDWWKTASPHGKVASRDGSPFLDPRQAPNEPTPQALQPNRAQGWKALEPWTVAS